MKKTDLLAALRAGKYEVSIEEPNFITEYTKYDGTPFLRLRQEDMNFTPHYGYCTVNVKSHEFKCHLEDGTWYENDKRIEDEELIAALQQSDTVISGAHSDYFSICELYARLNNLPENIDFCTESEEDALKDINELGASEVIVPILYTIKGHEDTSKEMDCFLSDGDLFNIYKFLREKKVLPVNDNEYELYDNSLKSKFPDLYDDIIEQIEENEDIEDDSVYRFIIPLSFHTFERGLYGEK